MRVNVNELKENVIKGVAQLGYEAQDAQVIADVLLYAQLRGNNQGIAKIATGGVPKATDVEELRLVSENKCGALISGGHSMVATNRAIEKAAELAAMHGVGVVGVNHTFSSSGAIGYFARQLAKQGYISFVCVGNGSFAFVAPAGSAEAKLGTNPFSYAFPYNGGEVVFDNATAAMAYFGIVEAKLSGQSLPDGVGYDKDGNPSTDASAVLDGSVATFAGYKGFGLSLLVQLLGGPFLRAAIPGFNEQDGAGTFVLAIDAGLLAGKDEFMKRSTELVQSMKAAKPVDGQVIALPGERGDEIQKQAEETGEIEIADGIWQELLKFLS